MSYYLDMCFSTGLAKRVMDLGVVHRVEIKTISGGDAQEGTVALSIRTDGEMPFGKFWEIVLEDINKPAERSGASPSTLEGELENFLPLIGLQNKLEKHTSSGRRGGPEH